MFISGASHGIGLSITERVAADGADVGVDVWVDTPNPANYVATTPRD
jgi:NAD(P)-dependent dehydrogenase (short-subunit alcohol dehydrogenase family)